MEKPKVYFTREINSANLIKLFKQLNVKPTNNVAVKLHSGEAGNQNYLKPEFVKDLIDYLNATVVECNTAYEGARNTTKKHLKLLEDHGWSKYFKVDILDSEADSILTNQSGAVIKKNYVGSKMANYDFLVVLSHFKGHPMGGFGGAIKNLSIGLASSYGKRYIHTGGKENASYDDMFNTKQEDFLKSMADAAKTITDFYQDRVVYLNAMVNMSVDCDCCSKAEDPCLENIGLLASTDPVAIDQACLDLVYNSKDPGKDKFIERVESRKGLLTIEAAVAQNMGSKEYDLVSID